MALDHIDHLRASGTIPELTAWIEVSKKMLMTAAQV